LGSGNTDIGNRSGSRKPGRSSVQGPTVTAPNSARMNRPAITGAMSQQCGDNGNFSAPQKFVHLVGCRDAKARPEPGLHPVPAKP
jgi:hypothetical protein